MCYCKGRTKNKLVAHTRGAKGHTYMIRERDHTLCPTGGKSGVIFGKFGVRQVKLSGSTDLLVLMFPSKLVTLLVEVNFSPKCTDNS